METKRVSFLEFRDYFLPFGYFSTHQVSIWNEGFNRNNLGRWVREGKIIRLRQGFYSFPSLLTDADLLYYLANKIYLPSYISLETALSFYGMIPEGVSTILSVTPRKTAGFENRFGSFIYRTIRSDLMFGYTLETSEFSHHWKAMIASPEKAILDFLYLNTQYSSASDMRELRLDIDYMQDEFNIDIFDEYIERFASKKLAMRASRLKGVYI